MKKVKTVKYFITTYLSDGVVTNKMEVSKKVFDRQFKSVQKQVCDQPHDTEFEVQNLWWSIDYDTYTERISSFNWAICSLDFTVLICKEGYHFK